MIVKTGRQIILNDVYTKMINDKWYVKIGTGTHIATEDDNDLNAPINTIKVVLSSSNCIKNVDTNSIRIDINIANEVDATNQIITEFGIFTNTNQLFSRVIQEPVVIGPSSSEILTYYLYL